VVDKQVWSIKLILAYKIFFPFDHLLGYRYSKSSVRKIIILFNVHGTTGIIVAV